MGKEKVTVDQVFAHADDAELNQRIAAFQQAHEAQHGTRLAMDARRPLGAGKTRVSFRVVEAKGKRR